MNITNKDIDGGKAFDWGKTSENYAKYRDIYPQEFYSCLTERGLCIKGQRVLDLGTGTGVIPRNMYRFGAKWTGCDISENQIEQAKLLAAKEGMDIDFFAAPAEEISFPSGTFDVITACQCFWYFDHRTVAPILADLLGADGRLCVMQMAWLPFDDPIAGKSEELVLKYNPTWTGGGWTRQPVHIDEAVLEHFTIEDQIGFDVSIPFTRESWNGRMKACRGVQASLSEEETVRWEKEHMQFLSETAPEKFDILHYAAIAVLKKKA